MNMRALQKLLRTHCLWLCAALALLGAFQPFLATHFREDGWEDEPELRFVTVGQSVQFEADDRPQYPDRRETTVYVAPGANIAQPDALALGLLALASLTALAGFFFIAIRSPACAAAQPPCEFMVAHQGAPPPPQWRQRWRVNPPAAAPPNPD